MTAWWPTWGWPVLTVAMALWAGWLALAAEGAPEGPASSTGRDPLLPEARRVHLAHLAVLFAAAACAGAAIRWWDAFGLERVFRLGLVLALAWVVGDLLPRVLAHLAPRLALECRRWALPGLALFTPLYWMAARAEALVGRETDTDRDAPATEPVAVAPGLLALPDRDVRDVMTPRIDIVAVDRTDTGMEVLETVRQSNYARLLVFDETPDDVVGVIYAKDLLARPPEPTDPPDAWHAFLRPAQFVPEGKPLAQQLTDFQLGRQHIAVVVDEHGGTAGLVTLEDVLEEIVGEIQDERDADEVLEIQEVDTDTWLVEGGAPLTDLEEVLQEEFGREDVTTVGGLVMAEFGRVPSARESLQLGRVRLTVNRMEGRRVQRVLVHLLEDGGEGEVGS